MVGIIGEVNLGSVIDSAADFALFLLTKTLQQRTFFLFTFPGQRGVGRNVPSLPHKHSPFHLPGRAPVPDRAFGEIVLLRKLTNGYIFHLYRQLSCLNRARR